MPVDHALVIEINDLLQTITLLGAIVGVPVALWKHFSENKKERITKEKEAFSASNQRYAEYLGLLLAHDVYDMFDLAERARKGSVPGPRSRSSPRSDLGLRPLGGSRPFPPLDGYDPLCVIRHCDTLRKLLDRSRPMAVRFLAED